MSGKNNLTTTNVKLDTEGRVIIFDIDNTTFCNVYMEAGTDSSSRSSRERYCNEILPNLLTNSCRNGCSGGDWNSIIVKKDATNYPESKFSPGLNRLVRLFAWKDSHNLLHPSSSDFSHFYKFGLYNTGATRLDRQYLWGDVTAVRSEYIPVAFSDHLGLLTEVKLPNFENQDILI